VVKATGGQEALKRIISPFCGSAETRSTFLAMSFY
jgi:hypothetical protein